MSDHILHHASVHESRAKRKHRASRKPYSTRRLIAETLEDRALFSVGPITAAFQASGTYSGMVDTRINSGSPTTNYGGSSVLTGNTTQSSLMKWDLGSIPAGATVQSAKLTLNVTNTSTNVFELYALKRNWSEGGTTWRNAASGTPWQVAGAKGANDRESTVLGTVTASSTGVKTFNLNSAGIAKIQSWINNPSSNFGFVLQDYSNTNTIQFSSSETGTTSLRPKLEITYTTGTTNAAPVVSAGADQSVPLASSATLDGTATDDGLPNPPGALTTTWTKVSGPGTVTFGNPAAVDTTARFSATGSYVLRLTASDGAQATTDDVTVAVTTNGGTFDSARATAEQQLLDTTREVTDPTRYPRSTDPSTGKWTTRAASDWTSGFYPGQLWMMYEATGNPALKTAAEKWLTNLAGQATRTDTHDVGFMIFDSFGPAYRITGNSSYKQTLLTAAKSLSTRFDPEVGAIRSWDTSPFNVIMDNMMNLELLFWGAKNGSDPAQNQRWYNMAVSHADVTAANHFRPDGSTRQIVYFDPNTGDPTGVGVHQAYSADSTWSRGQAWAIHGFTTVYRETGEARFLDTAKRAADYFINHLPADKVPYWDFNAPNIPNEPRDSSAAAIAASGLLELSRLADNAQDRDRYFGAAEAILKSLSSPTYLSDGVKSSGILLKGTGNKPKNTEVGVSLIYGDYYFIEALKRYQAIVDSRTAAVAPTMSAAPSAETSALVASSPASTSLSRSSNDTAPQVKAADRVLAEYPATASTPLDQQLLSSVARSRVS